LVQDAGPTASAGGHFQNAAERRIFFGGWSLMNGAARACGFRATFIRICCGLE